MSADVFMLLVFWGGRKGPPSLGVGVCNQVTSSPFPTLNQRHQNLPAELIAQFSTVEYELQTPPAGAFTRLCYVHVYSDVHLHAAHFTLRNKNKDS